MPAHSSADSVCGGEKKVTDFGARWEGSSAAIWVSKFTTAKSANDI